MVVYSGVGILRWFTVVCGGGRWCTVVHVGVWVVVVHGGARVRWCSVVYDGARSAVVCGGVRWCARAVVCGGVRWCMAVYVAKKIILKYCSKEFWQRGRLGVVVYGLCVQRVQVV
jgi:hypothetical protein